MSRPGVLCQVESKKPRSCTWFPHCNVWSQLRTFHGSAPRLLCVLRCTGVWGWLGSWLSSVAGWARRLSTVRQAPYVVLIPLSSCLMASMISSFTLWSSLTTSSRISCFIRSKSKASRAMSFALPAGFILE